MGEPSTCAAEPKGAQDLLVEFQQTGRQEPFEEIARRYAGMVYNVALQVTKDTHDAEDATQATFLTLAVHAKTAGKIRYVGPWLRKVSHRLALDIRRSKKRRRAREERHAHSNGNGNGNGNGHDVPVSNDLQHEELRHILREELDKLPGKYRMPLILYYFGGLSPEEMGKELQCNTSTLGVRLHRGRKMLAENLAERGITINSAVLGIILAGMVDTYIRDNLVHAAAQAAVQVAGNGFVAHSAATPAHLLGMIQNVTTNLLWSRVKAILTAVVLLGTTLAGAGEILHRYDLLDWSVLERLNPLRLVKPIFDRLLTPGPILSQATPAPATMEPVEPVAAVPASAVIVQELSMVGAPLPPPLPPISRESPTAPAASRNATVLGGSLAQLAQRVNLMPLPASSPPFELAPVQPVAPLLASSATRSVTAAQHAAAFIPPTNLMPPPTSSGVASIDSASPGLSGHAVMSHGEYHVKSLVIGDTSIGQLTQTGGQIYATESVVLGKQAGSEGTFVQSPAGQLFANSITVGGAGKGTFDQSGDVQGIPTSTANTTDGTPADTSAASGPVPVKNVVIASDVGSSGDYILRGGKLVAESVIVGRMGTGKLVQSGGDAQVSYASLGELASGSGFWSLDRGMIEVAQPGDNDAGLAGSFIVGREGLGAFLFRPSDETGTAITEKAGTRGASLLVRSDEGGDGIFRGWGQVKLTGPFVQNGRVIADGYGSSHALDFSAAAMVSNTIENSPDGGINGWFARSGGSIVLPPLRITDSGTHTWGEDRNDPVLDLVNSLRIDARDVRTPGELRIALRDAESPDLPPLPWDLHALAAWSIDSTAELGSMDLVIRYDDVQAALLGWREGDLALWVYENGWHPIKDSSFGLDTRNHLIRGTTAQPSFVAVSLIPEPAFLVMGALAAGSMLMRRRR